MITAGGEGVADIGSLRHQEQVQFSVVLAKNAAVARAIVVAIEEDAWAQVPRSKHGRRTCS